MALEPLNYDNYQGSIFGHTSENGILTYNPPALYMCDGSITGIEDGPDSVVDLTTSGRTVYYACDSFSQVFNSQINIVYRHLDSIKSSLLRALIFQKEIHWVLLEVVELLV